MTLKKERESQPYERTLTDRLSVSLQIDACTSLWPFFSPKVAVDFYQQTVNLSSGNVKSTFKNALSHSKYSLIINSLLLCFHKFTVCCKVALSLFKLLEAANCTWGEEGGANFASGQTGAVGSQEKGGLPTQSAPAFERNQRSPSWMTNLGVVVGDL